MLSRMPRYDIRAARAPESVPGSASGDISLLAAGLLHGDEQLWCLAELIDAPCPAEVPGTPFVLP